MNESFNTFFTWGMLSTLAGAGTANRLITAFLDTFFNRGGRIPTQIIAYGTALAILLLSLIFTGGFSANTGILCVFNALVVSSAASGTISMARRLIRGKEVR